MALDDQIGAALDAAVASVATAVVGRVRDVLGVFLGIIGSGLSIVEAVLAPFVGEVSAIVNMRAALNDIVTWTGTELTDLQREGILKTIADVSAVAEFPLDRESPFSAESLTGAVNARLGLEFENVTDADIVLRDVKKLIASRINEVVGIDAMTHENLEEPEAWGNLVAALIAESINGAGFIGEHVCPAANVVLSTMCKTVECNFCMGETGEADCIAKREKARRHREKHPKDCIRKAR